MIKATKVLGVVNIIISIFLGFLSVSILFQMKNLSGEWGAIIFALVAGFFIAVAIVLTILFIIFLVKFKFEPIKFYFFSHLLLIISSVSLFLISISLN